MGAWMRVVLAMAAMLVAATALAQPSSAITWSAPVLTHTAQPFNFSLAVTSIACPVTSLCVAVDDGGIVTTSHDAFSAAPHWSTPAPAGVGSSVSVTPAISCPTTTFCALALTNKFTITTNAGDAAPTWSAIRTIPTGVVDIVAMSCPSPTLCVATNGSDAFAADPSAATPTWTITSVVDSSTRKLSGLACPAADLCVAADDHGGVSISKNPGAASPTWTLTENVGVSFEGIACPTTGLCVSVDGPANEAVVSTNPAAATPSWAKFAATGDVGRPLNLQSVSCVGTTLCMLVGDVALVSTDPAAASPTWRTSTPPAFSGAAVACASATSCIVVRGGAPAQEGTTTVTTDAGAAAPTFTPPAFVTGANTLTAVACPTESLCVASDFFRRLLSTTNPALSSPTWRTTTVAATNNATDGIFTDVECPAANLCLALARSGRLLASSNPGADAPSWPEVLPRSAGVAAVSCASPAFCMTVSFTAKVRTSTDAGATWSPPVDIDQGGSGPWLDCPTTGLCVMVTTTRDVYATTDPTAAVPTWTTTPLTLEQPSDLACPSEQLCLVALENGQVQVSTNPGAAAPTWSAASPLGVLELSCASPSFCAGIGPGGARSSTTPAGAWDAVAPISPSLTNVGCASPSLCVAVDGYGHVAYGVAAPAVSTVPTVSGTADVGNVLTATAATWSGGPEVNRGWVRCDGAGSACVDLAGATGSTYTVVDDDRGHTLRRRETAVNRRGTTSADSAPTALIPAPAAPTPTPTPTPTPPETVGPSPTPSPTPPAPPSEADIRARLLRALAPTGKAARLPQIRSRAGFVSSFAAPSAGRLTITWKSVGRRPVVLAKATLTVRAAGIVRPRVKLTAAGKKAVRAAKRLKVAATGTFAPSGRKAINATKPISLKR